MTNTSVGKMIAVLSVVAMTTLASGAFVSVAHADGEYGDIIGYADLYGDNLGYADVYGDNLGYADVYGDNLGYADVYGDNLGYADIYGDNLGYADVYGDNLGYADVYGDNLGYADVYGDNLGYADIYGDNLGYADRYGTQTTSPSYTSQTPYYSSGCNCYASSPSYKSPTYSTSYMPTYAYNSIPQRARQYIPSYVYSPTPSYTSSRQPTYAMTSTPAPTYNTNTNANTNSNVNNPTAVATATATNGDNVNTNVASTGAITNTFAPVINVGASGSTQRPAQYEFPRPVCTIYSSGSYNQVTLTWSSQNAKTAYISPNVGSVPVNGSRQVYAQGYTTFTLTVTGPGGSETCQTASNYAPSYTVAPTYPVAASPAPYVALSQIPYTGFDYGPVGNAIYWTAILAFAAAAGYLLVYGMPKFAFAGFARKEESPIREASPSNGAGTKDEDIAEVFKSSIAPATELVLPIARSSHAGLTSDAMIIDRSSGTPRIVIARA